MGNLTFQEISDPLTHRRVIRHWISYPPKLFSANKDPRNSRESEGLCSEAWSRGWPLASAERAASTSRGGVERVSEGGGERIAMHGSPPLVSASEDAYHHFGVQLWSGRVPIDDFLSPLVLKGHQESCSYLLNASRYRFGPGSVDSALDTGVAIHGRCLCLCGPDWPSERRVICSHKPSYGSSRVRQS
jgi:hypothetical protein